MNHKLSCIRVPLTQNAMGEMRRSSLWNWGTIERRVHSHWRLCVRPAANNSLILLTTELVERLWQRHKVEPDRCYSPFDRGKDCQTSLQYMVLYLFVPPVKEPSHLVSWEHLNIYYIWTLSWTITTDTLHDVFTGRTRHLGLGINVACCTTIWVYHSLFCIAVLLVCVAP